MPRRPVSVSPPFLLICALLGIAAPKLAQAQIDTRPSTVPEVSRPGLPHGDAEDDPFRDNPQLRDRLQRGRAADRQRRIVDDANRLVALTAQYRKALDAHGTPTDDDQKLLVQIEKLARDVKDRMRGM